MNNKFKRQPDKRKLHGENRSKKTYCQVSIHLSSRKFLSDLNGDNVLRNVSTYIWGGIRAEDLNKVHEDPSCWFTSKTNKNYIKFGQSVRERQDKGESIEVEEYRNVLLRNVGFS